MGLINMIKILLINKNIFIKIIIVDILGKLKEVINNLLEM
jgi:hypothetical protein